MVNFAISVNLIFAIENSLIFTLCSPTVLTVELSNFDYSSFMVSSYRLVLLRRLILLARHDELRHFRQLFVCYIEKKIFLICFQPSFRETKTWLVRSVGVVRR